MQTLSYALGDRPPMSFLLAMTPEMLLIWYTDAPQKCITQTWPIMVMLASEAMSKQINLERQGSVQSSGRHNTLGAVTIRSGLLPGFQFHWLSSV